jgi:preprotein translocase subunit SecG
MRAPVESRYDVQAQTALRKELEAAKTLAAKRKSDLEAVESKLANALKRVSVCVCVLFFMLCVYLHVFYLHV